MIYISACTMPDRLHHEHSSRQFINALLNQDTTKPYKIVLNYPYKLVNYPDDPCTVPAWLQELIQANSEKIILLRDDIDYGPITNILYPIKHIPMDPDDIIIVCDDDHEYHKDLIDYHIFKLQEYPKNHCICFRGNDPKEMRTWSNGSERLGKLYNSCILFPTPIDKYLRFPDHWHSVSYRRHMFQNDIFDTAFLDMTWNNDLLMGYYGWTHDLFFVCANYDRETDYRPVNYDGRGSHSFPIVQPLPFDENSGCNRWRQKESVDIWQNPKFITAMNTDKGIIKLS